MTYNNNHINLDDWNLHRAAGENRVDILGLLLRRGFDIETRDIFDCRPLHVAAMTNSVDSANFLVDHGAHIDAKDEAGETSLDHAIEHRNVEVTGYLLSKSADFEYRDFSWIGHELESAELPTLGFRSRSTYVRR